MTDTFKDGFADRLQAAAKSKQALLAKFQPKSAATDPLHAERPAMRAAELARVREGRADAKAQAKAAVELAAEQARQAAAEVEAAALEAKRGARRERQALTKAEQKAKRDARYAARKARK